MPPKLLVCDFSHWEAAKSPPQHVCPPLLVLVARAPSHRAGFFYVAAG